MPSPNYSEGAKIGGNYQRVMLGSGTNGAVNTISSCTTSITTYAITDVSSISGLSAGMLVSGGAFMPNTYITSASGSTVNISRYPKTAGDTNQAVTFSKVYTAGHDDGFELLAGAGITITPSTGVGSGRPTFSLASTASGADGMGAGFTISDGSTTDTVTTSETVVFSGTGLDATIGSNTVAYALDISEYSDVAPANGDKLLTLDSNGSTEQLSTVHALASLFSGAGLTTTNAVTAVDADQSSQITLVGTQTALNVAGAVDINATTHDIDASTSVAIDCSNTSNGITIGTVTSGVPVSIGHGTSEVSFGDNVTIAGTLTVSGGTTTISSTILTVDDKNIELGSVDTPTDTTADGGGITLKGATDKTITWDNSNDNWTSNQDWNIASGTVFRVNNVEVLTGVALGSAIVGAPGLVTVSTLDTGAISSGFGAIDNGASAITTTGTITGGLLNVDNLRLDANTLSSTNSNGNIVLTPNGSGVVSIAAGNLSYATTAVTSTGAELNLVDGSSAGTVVNSKAVIYSSAGQVKASQLSVDAIAIVDTGTSVSSQTVANGATEDVFSYAYATYRTAKFVYQVSDGTDFESGELLINYKGASAPTNSDAIYLNQYGIVSTKASNASLVSWDAVKDGSDITIQFTNGTGGSVDYDYSVVNTQLIK